MRYGYFDNENREYVIERPDVPVSWTNYLGTEDLCTVISHNAGGYSFFKSSQYHRITRFRQNGIPLDRPGHYVYLRDDDTGDYWSVSWQPVGKNLDKANYQCRHGLSYSKFLCGYNGINASQLLFIPIGDDAELWDVEIVNESGKPRNISVFSYLEFSFEHIDIDNQNLQMSLYSSGTSYKDGIIEFDLFYDPEGYHYFTSNFDPDGYDCVRDSFIGRYRTEDDPIAVERGCCSGSTELGGNHCASLHKKLTLAPGQKTRLIYMLGIGGRDDGRKMRSKYADVGNVDKAFEELRLYWDKKLSVLQCSTPHPGMDTMTNIWTLYQAETNVVWSRFASFIEVGGRTGLGYRDTAQDAMCVPHSNPGKTRQRLIELLRGLTNAGYGLHLFEPELFNPEKPPKPPFKSPTVVPVPDLKDVIHGLKDTCSDDALWLVPSICEYVKETGDTSFFDLPVTFADGGEASVYEHMKRILDFSAEQVGENGICKGLRADWNDCLNLGGGESALVSFLHFWALMAFIEASVFLGKKAEAAKYKAIALKVNKACEEVLWDGKWYIRGITAKGAKIGTQKDTEGKVHLESNTWAVISGAASHEKALSCMDAVDEHLYSGYGLHLVWPSFSTPNDDIGFVTRVYRGIKENGAIFSHPNPWAWAAECILGRGDRAMKFYDALLPYNQNDRIEVRQSEPYSYCQFVMGRDHTAHGRARHPWLTGTAGWAYFATTHYMLGIRPGYEGLTVDPCIPSDWKSFEVSRTWRGAVYKISVKNPKGAQKGILSVTLNGRAVNGPIAPQAEGTVNKVDVVMG
ncbi:MAG TPA: N,N'-diacetylchitobiose phosphorylase [Clostridia bacterium]|nr:N,N'-diacetylchitobiose phosphorylase [Clostridia bacterium]